MEKISVIQSWEKDLLVCTDGKVLFYTWYKSKYQTQQDQDLQTVKREGRKTLFCYPTLFEKS